MSYQVGVDVGGTFTTAAVVRRGRAEVVSMVPTQLPGVPRGFLNRVGDDTPVLVGTRAVPAETLVAQLVAQVVSTIGKPTALAVTHPVTWGPHRVAALRAALGEVTMLSTAAAVAYQSEYPTAVHDLGGSTFTAAVVRGLATIGQPVELDLGGADLDELVFDHVREAAGADWPTEPAALSHLRQACTTAKEALSADTETEISVGGTRVRLTRAEFEEMARPLLAETAVALRMTIEESGITPATVLLTGGAAWLPLLTQVVSEELGRPVTATPPGAAAMGASLAAAGISPTPAARPANPVGMTANQGPRPTNQTPAGPAGLPAALRPATPSAVGAVGLSAASAIPNRGNAFAAAGTGPAPDSRPNSGERANHSNAAGTGPEGRPNRAGGEPAGRGDAAFASAGSGPAGRRVDSPTRLAVSLEPTGFSGEVRTAVVEPVRPPVPSADAPAGGKPKRTRTMIAAAAAGFVAIGAAAGIALSSKQSPAGADAETLPTTTTVTSTVSLTTTEETPEQTVPQQAPPKTQTTSRRPTTTTTTAQPTTTTTTSAPTTTTTTTVPTSARTPENDDGGDR